MYVTPPLISVKDKHVEFSFVLKKNGSQTFKFYIIIITTNDFSHSDFELMASHIRNYMCLPLYQRLIITCRI